MRLFVVLLFTVVLLLSNHRRKKMKKNKNNGCPYRQTSKNTFETLKDKVHIERHASSTQLQTFLIQWISDHYERVNTHSLTNSIIRLLENSDKHDVDMYIMQYSNIRKQYDKQFRD